MQKYPEKSSMFPEDLFTVVVQRRSVASSLLPRVDTGRTGSKFNLVEIEQASFLFDIKKL